MKCKEHLGETIKHYCLAKTCSSNPLHCYKCEQEKHGNDKAS